MIQICLFVFFPFQKLKEMCDEKHYYVWNKTDNYVLFMQSMNIVVFSSSGSI